LDYIATHTSLSPIRRGFTPGFANYKKGCTRLAAASDKAYQLLAHGRWVSPGTPASFTTKTGRHDTTEILLKVTLKHQQSKIKLFSPFFPFLLVYNDVKNYSIFQLSQFCIFILHFAIKVKLVWDEVPTMVEIAIF
jgi:hypothetical protein